MTSLNLYDQYECDQAYMNNLCELESVISQYIEVNNINTELVDRIICKVMMNENYEKINILITESNRLLNQYYLPYQIKITSNIDNLVKVEISNVNNIIYTTIECTLTVIDSTTTTLVAIINDETITNNITIGESITIGTTEGGDFIDLTILNIAQTNFTIEIVENTLITLTYDNVLQDLNLYLLNIELLVDLADKYDQQNTIESITNTKEKLECHKQYLIEKMDLICKYKKKIRGHSLSCKMVGSC